MSSDNELRALAQQHGGLDPENVVAFARDPSTALHERFEWDDSLAAHQHRLSTARRLIRVVMQPNANTKQPQFVHVRTGNGPPYREVDKVKASKVQRADAVALILAKLVGYRENNAWMTELQPIWDAIDAAKIPLDTLAIRV